MAEGMTVMIPQATMAEAITMAHNWGDRTPIYIIGGLYEMHGRWSVTRNDYPWWAPLPYTKVAIVRETATGVDIDSML